MNVVFYLTGTYDMLCPIHDPEAFTEIEQAVGFLLLPNPRDDIKPTLKCFWVVNLLCVYLLLGLLY